MSALPLDEADVFEPSLHCDGGDVEHVSECVEFGDAFTPESLDPSFGHEQAGGEIVTGRFDLLVAVDLVLQLTECGAEQGCVEDVFELVGQREALAHQGFGAVDLDAPGSGLPLGGARCR